MTITLPIKQTPEGWLQFFNKITEKDMNQNFPSVEELLYPIHNELEQILLGVEAFVTYPIYWCSRMLGHCKVPMNISFIHRVEAR